MSSKILKYTTVFSVAFVLIPTLFIPTFLTSSNSIDTNQFSNGTFIISNYSFYWPVPGYTKISSYFGARISPTKGASSYHQGIDIPAPVGTRIISCFESTVTFIGFYGSGGYSIVLKNNNLDFIYHHVSLNYIVDIGEHIYAGQIIGYVGPKNVYNVKGNPYKDSNGNPTNGSTTGPHLHFSIKKDGYAVNPLNFF